MFRYNTYQYEITKALISLRGCAGWSAALLFANHEDRFSYVEAHTLDATAEWYKIIVVYHDTDVLILLLSYHKDCNLEG